MAAKWKEFVGDVSQLNEISQAKDGYLLRYKNGDISEILFFMNGAHINLLSKTISHYLICQQLPHAKMIVEHAMTGQEVFEKSRATDIWPAEPVINPQWKPGFEYLFKEPGPVVEKIYYRNYIQHVKGCNEIHVMYSREPFNATLKHCEFKCEWIDENWQEVEVPSSLI